MDSNNICAKNSQTFCYSCAKRGITSELVQFHVNLEEAILLCVNQGCLYPFRSGDISSFIVQKRSKGTAFSGYVESKFTRAVSLPGKESGGTRENKLRKTKHNFLTMKSATDEQRTSLAGCVKGDFCNSGIPLDVENTKIESYPEMDKKCVLPYSVQKDKEFVRSRRSRKTVFEPYTPRRKSFSNSLLLKDNVCNKECTQLPVDLEQNYKELSKDEENFVIDIVLKTR